MTIKKTNAQVEALNVFVVPNNKEVVEKHLVAGLEYISTTLNELNKQNEKIHKLSKELAVLMGKSDPNQADVKKRLDAVLGQLISFNKNLKTEKQKLVKKVDQMQKNISSRFSPKG